MSWLGTAWFRMASSYGWHLASYWLGQWGSWASWFLIHQKASLALFTWWLDRFPGEVEMHMASWSLLRTGTLSLLPYSIDQSNSQGQPQFREWGNRFCLLMGGGTKSHCKWCWYRKIIIVAMFAINLSQRVWGWLVETVREKPQGQGGWLESNHSSDWEEKDRMFAQTLRWGRPGWGTIEEMKKSLNLGPDWARQGRKPFTELGCQQVTAGERPVWFGALLWKGLEGLGWCQLMCALRPAVYRLGDLVKPFNISWPWCSPL